MNKKEIKLLENGNYDRLQKLCQISAFYNNLFIARRKTTGELLVYGKSIRQERQGS